MSADGERSGFFLVWTPSNERTPTYRHPSSDAAEKEADRLAKLNPGQDFYVLAAISKSRVYGLVTTQLTFGDDTDDDEDDEIDPDDIPF